MLMINGLRGARDSKFSRVDYDLGIMFIHPFHLLLAALAQWVNREQAAIIDYLKEENRVLRDRLGSKRIRFTDAERRRLTVKAKALGRSLLRDLCPSSPQTPCFAGIANWWPCGNHSSRTLK